jgi:hypothetical protein
MKINNNKFTEEELQEQKEDMNYELIEEKYFD